MPEALTCLGPAGKQPGSAQGAAETQPDKEAVMKRGREEGIGHVQIKRPARQGPQSPGSQPGSLASSEAQL